MLLTISKDHLKKYHPLFKNYNSNLEKYLGTKFAPVSSHNFKCDICNLFIGKNIKSLSKHKTNMSQKNDLTICVETKHKLILYLMNRLNKIQNIFKKIVIVDMVNPFGIMILNLQDGLIYL